MEVVLIGPPGSGKSAVGRRLATRHGADFIDVDEMIEQTAGRSIASIFETEGEGSFRERERAAIAGLGAPDAGDALRRAIAVGGGAVVDPRNRWALFRGRRVISLQASPDLLARRLQGGPSRPLLAGREPTQLLRELLERRARFYAAGEAVDASGHLGAVAARVEAALRLRPPDGTLLLRAATRLGVIALCDGGAAARVIELLASLDADRVAIVSEPQVWRLHGARISAGIASAGIEVVPFSLPRGEAAKTPAAYGRLLRDMAVHRLERRDPLVAIGGGALGDAAGFAAATYLRGVPLIHVPTTLVAQIDSSIGGKTGIDLPIGKNLVGAFHQPAGVVIDVSLLSTLPSRHRRAALGEAIKYAALGDPWLFSLLEVNVDRLARGDRRSIESGALAELVERCAWSKLEVVSADEREMAGRIVLNLGHSLGHAVEAAAGYRRLLHGEAVAYGLLGALAVGRAIGVTPPEVAARIERLIDAAGLAQDPPRVEETAVRTFLAQDKKHAAGRLRWVLPVETGVVVHADVPDAAVEAGIAAALAGRTAVRDAGSRAHVPVRGGPG